MDQTHSVQFQSLQYSLAHYTPDCDYSESYTVNLSTISSNQIGRMYKPRVQRMESFTQIQPRIRHSLLIQSLPNYNAPNTTAVASAAAAPFRSHGVAAARAIQHILLGEISCRSQRIDSTRSRGWVVQSRD